MNRIYELDFVRGICIILVVLYHIVVTINDYFGLNFYTHTIYISMAVNFVVSAILTISGISAYLGKNTLKRGIVVLIVAICVTIITYFFMPESFVRFGILHLIGICMMIVSLIKRFDIKPWILIFISALCISLGIYFGTLTVNNPYLFAFNITSFNYYTIDHYPLLPWLGIYLMGYVFATIYYKEHKSIFNLQYKNNIFSFCGRHSLIIYALHQPIVFPILYFIFK